MKVENLNFNFGEADNFYDLLTDLYADNFTPSEVFLKTFRKITKKELPNKIWNLRINKEGIFEMKSIDNTLIFTCKLFIKELGLSNLSLINTEEK